MINIILIRRLREDSFPLVPAFPCSIHLIYKRWTLSTTPPQPPKKKICSSVIQTVCLRSDDPDIKRIGLSFYGTKNSRYKPKYGKIETKDTTVNTEHERVSSYLICAHKTFSDHRQQKKLDHFPVK
jgi:hypothetical protein